MTCRTICKLLSSLLAAIGCLLTLECSPANAQNVYRGAVPGWPGNTGYYAPQNVYQIPPGGAPVVTARYAPQTAYYAPAATQRIAYAVPAGGSYQISYAGANQPGMATTAYYGGYSAPVQRVAYLAPQQIYYRPVPVSVPVTYYRPVTVYQPGIAAPTTCQYATACNTTSCGTSRTSCWRPFAWLWGGSSTSCNKSCAPATTCNYGCAQQAPQGCGAVPYYTTPPTIPVIPATPAPPAFGLPSGVSPGIITSPPTRSPGSINAGPPAASTIPRLTPGTTITPAPSNPNFNSGPPAGSFNPGGFGNPPATNPPTQFGPDGRPIINDNFRPTYSDPYSQTIPSTTVPPVMMTPPASSTAPVYGSGYHNETPATFNDRATLTQPENRAIGEPGLLNNNTNPDLIAPPASVKPLADPHADERTPANRAPALLAPGDRTAKSDGRWSVVPAVWPVNSQRSQQVRGTIAPQTHLQPVATSNEALVPVSTQIDDGGWKSAR